MDVQFNGLPPNKRFRILQQQRQKEEQDGCLVNSLSLPAKKRKESRDQVLLPSPEMTAMAASSASYRLPTKKRVWALRPDSTDKEQLPESNDQVLFPPSPEMTVMPASMTSYQLPTKKRVWAPQPDFAHKERPPSFDLNVEYKPHLEEESAAEAVAEEEERKVLAPVSENQSIELTENENQAPDEEEVNDGDDGIVCAVCQSTDGDPSDPIVFCDGCDVMVHASCYGNPLSKGVPEGDWFCAQCSASSSSSKNENVPGKGFSCCLCPVNGGAMKPTKEGSWAHIVCALYVPEVFFEDPEGREGIDCSKVPKRRWRQRCYLCKSAGGCTIDCSEPNCPLAFHVTCGLSEDLSIEYREGRKKGAAIVAGFCKKHTELWKKQQQTGKYKIVARGDQM